MRRSISVRSAISLFAATAAYLPSRVSAVLNATETNTTLVLSNNRFYASLNKSLGYIDGLFLDGQNLLGVKSYNPETPGANAAGQNGVFNMDCYCTPSGVYTPGRIAPYFKLLKGNDSTGTPYGGMVMGEVYPPTGQRMESYWFLREGETGLHTFSRLAYYNETTPFLRNLQEMRTLFRPSTPLWTHLSTNKDIYGPKPPDDVIADSVTVQDATWDIGNYTTEPYVVEVADYFTKYTFSDEWRDHDVHGMFADGSASDDGSTFGSWLVMNTRDTYFGGPLHSDLTVDGIVYNYLTSNHHGDQTANITNGFDRTFGPFFYHFNKGPPNATLQDLRREAVPFASPTWNVAFYDSIASSVPNLVPSRERATWKGKIDLPEGAKRPVAVLSVSGVDFQDNVVDTKAYQYWGDIDTESGNIEIPMVKAGIYRLTVYADGIFGQYFQDGIKIRPGNATITHAVWKEESAGTELWRIGTPDKSSGEYKHGIEPTLNRTLGFPEYRIYWAQWDFPSDFPNGVVFTVGESDEAEDLNYVHWSVFGGYADSIRTQPYTDNVNNWTILFDGSNYDLGGKESATFTIQLAGAKTAAGNTDVFNVTQAWSNMPLTVVVNGNELDPWVIPYYQSSSCAVRSAVICYNLAHKFVFDAALLTSGTNEIVLSLPFNGTDYESAVLPRALYVQYDALRLEVK